MSTYIVTYDLNQEATRPPIVETIKEFDRWAKLSESSYAISTAMSVQKVYDVLKPLIDSNDNLYVITLKQPYTGFGPEKVNEWLNSNLSF
jgi:hypothetical protein